MYFEDAFFSCLNMDYAIVLIAMSKLNGFAIYLKINLWRYALFVHNFHFNYTDLELLSCYASEIEFAQNFCYNVPVYRVAIQ